MPEIKPWGHFSFKQRMERGATKKELMEYYLLDEEGFKKTIACLNRIKQEAGKKQQAKGGV